MLKTLLLFVSCSLWCFGSMDTTMLYNRKLNEPPILLDRNKKVLLIAPYRTGSTLMYNILHFLFEDISSTAYDRSKRVIKLHPDQEKDILNFFYTEYPDSLIFICIRDPLESLQSFCNLCKVNDFSRVNACIAAIKDQNQFLLDWVNRNQHHPSHFLFRYEDFASNFSFVLDEIEKRLQVTISTPLRNSIENLFTIEAMQSVKITRHFGVDKLTMLLKDHVKNPLHPFLYSEEFLNYVNPQLEATKAMWGY